MKDFNKKNYYKITGRSTTITGTFVKSMLPNIYASDKEVKEVFDTLSIDPSYPKCAYCRKVEATDWDHFEPIVKHKMHSSYFNDIYNAVPSCSTCNQSKGGSYWKDWLNGKAKNSPKNRIRNFDIKETERYLEKYEKLHIKKCRKLDKSKISKELKNDLKEYYFLRDDILKQLKEAQKKAEIIKGRIQTEIIDNK